jgi:RNA polymerase sigma-19 factor, ECF subfamily
MRYSAPSIGMAEFDAALGRLLQAIRLIFILNRVDGLTHTQIAWRMAVDLNAVEQALAEALRLLHISLYPPVARQGTVE